MPSKAPLSDKKSQWVKGRTTKLKGHPLNYNAGDQSRYARALLKLVRQMKQETNKKLTDLFSTEYSKSYFKQQKVAATDESIANRAKKVTNSLMEKYTKLFNSISAEEAKEMIEGTKKTSESNLQASVKKLTGYELDTSIVPKGMEEVSQALINENVSLIKSIPQKYLNDVSGAVMRSITEGHGLASLVPQLMQYGGQAERRAKNLALDQVRKAYSAINKQRMQGMGIKKFEWMHTGGSAEPRLSHQKIDGKVFSFDDLPLKGEEGFVNGQYPGQAINCRCTMIPVIEFEDGDQV